MFPGHWGWGRSHHEEHGEGGGGCGEHFRHARRAAAYAAGDDGGGLGVRRPLRFMAYKLDLNQQQVDQLAKILDDLKTERAQAAVEERRVLGHFADALGGDALAHNISLLRLGGRLVNIALMQGRTGELDLGQVLSRRLHLVGSTLRTRPSDEKVALTAQFRREVWPAFARGELVPVIDRTFPRTQLAEAYAHLGANGTVGKVIVTDKPRPIERG